jgi:cellulose synthase (UDP-forming)
MLSQRQRWATGTMQVFFSDNPLVLRGLTIGQRLMYLATMTSYLTGFAAVVYIAAPIVFLVSGIFPIHCDSIAFFVYFMPFFICSQFMFVIAGNRARGLWRGQQMSFALFPTWIKATLAGASAAFFNKTLTFAVTQKTKQASGVGLRHVVPQVVAIVALVLAGSYGAVQAINGQRPQFASTITLLWVLVDLALLVSMVRAARYHGPNDAVQSPFAPRQLAEVNDVIGEVRYGQQAARLSRLDARDRPILPSPSRATGAGVSAPATQLCAAARFDAAAALALRSNVAERAQDYSPMVLIDVSGVRVVTPSGVAAMLDLLRLVRSRGGDLRIFGASRSFTLAHETMSLSHVTRLHGDCAEASEPLRAVRPQRGRGAHRERRPVRARAW